MNASIIDGLISAAAGSYLTLIGFGVISPGKDKKKREEMLEKWGSLFKIGGPLIVLWGTYNIVRGL